MKPKSICPDRLLSIVYYIASIDNETYDRLKAIAKVRQQTVSLLGNRIITDWLVTHGSDNAPITYWLKGQATDPNLIAMPPANWLAREYDSYFDDCDTEALKKIADKYRMVANMAQDHIDHREQYPEDTHRVYVSPRWEES